MKFFLKTSAVILLLFVNSFGFSQQKDGWKNYNLFEVKLKLPRYFVNGKKNEYNTYTFLNTIHKTISLNVECLIAS